MNSAPDAAPPRISRELAWAVTGALRLVGPARPAVVGVEHLVVSLALRTNAWRDMAGSRLPALRRAVRTGAADRTVDFGEPGWLSDVEVDGLLREACWLQARPAREHRPGSAPQWSVKVRAALREAMTAAAGAARPLCDVPDLSGVLMTNRRLGAVDFLRRHRVEPRLSTTDDPGHAWTPAVASMRLYGLIGRSSRPAWSVLVTRVSGLADAFFAIEMEAARQAVRSGATQVDGGHLVLAVCSVDDQFGQASVDRVGDPVGAARAASALRACGLDLETLAVAAARAEQVPRPEATRRRRRPWRHSRKGPSWTVAAAAAAEAARTAADPPAVGLLESALSTDVAAQDLVRRCGAQPSAVQSALDAAAG